MHARVDLLLLLLCSSTLADWRELIVRSLCLASQVFQRGYRILLQMEACATFKSNWPFYTMKQFFPGKKEKVIWNGLVNLTSFQVRARMTSSSNSVKTFFPLQKDTANIRFLATLFESSFTIFPDFFCSTKIKFGSKQRKMGSKSNLSQMT